MSNLGAVRHFGFDRKWIFTISRSLIGEHIKFEVACLVRRCLSTWLMIVASCPTAVGALCGQLIWRSDLHGATNRTLNSYGDRTFVVAGSRLLNSLRVQPRNPDATGTLYTTATLATLFLQTMNTALCDLW